MSRASVGSHYGAVSLVSMVSMGHRGCLNPKLTCTTKEDVYSCSINPNGDLLAASLADGTALLYEMQAGSVVYKLESPYREKLPAASIEFRPQPAGEAGLQNVVLASYSSGHVQQWHAATNKSLSLVQEGRQTLIARYSPDASTYSTSGSDHKIIVYDTATSTPITTLEASTSLATMDGHMNRVFALRYHPSEPHLLVSAGWDDTVQFWDTRQQTSIRKISGPHVCGNALDIEPSSFNVLTGSWRLHSPLEVWDFHSCKLLYTSSACVDTKLYAACWMEYGHVLVGGSLKHRAMVLDMVNDRVVGDLGDLVDAGVYDVIYDVKSKYAVVATGDKMHLCYLPLPKRSNTFITDI